MIKINKLVERKKKSLGKEIMEEGIYNGKRRRGKEMEKNSNVIWKRRLQGKSEYLKKNFKEKEE